VLTVMALFLILWVREPAFFGGLVDQRARMNRLFPMASALSPVEILFDIAILGRYYFADCSLISFNQDHE
jgi:hypothetical protein